MPPRHRPASLFIADAMLGSLARKLRALGFDTSYYRDGVDEGILRISKAQDRILLTSDRSLADIAARRGTRHFLLTGENDAQRFASLAELCRSSGFTLVRGDPLCSVCGGRLVSLAKVDVSGAVPPQVFSRHRKFYRCVECGRRYWRGSHWKKLRWFQRILKDVTHAHEH